AHTVRIRFDDASALHGAADLYQFSASQYLWHAEGDTSRPVRDQPPEHRVLTDGAAEIVLPPYSISVVRASPAPTTGSVPVVPRHASPSSPPKAHLPPPFNL